MSAEEIEKPKRRLELFALGDRELWVVDGDDKSWSIPLFLDWKVDKSTNDQFAFLYCALAPYPNQSIAIRARLSPVSLLESQDRWLIEKETAIRLLRKAPGITPRYYYRWPDPHYVPIPIASPMRIDHDFGDQVGSWDFEAFLRYIGQRYSIPLVMLRSVWKAVCQEAPVWMMESRRPLDLGFCRLAALPFRVNWKDIVRTKINTRKLAGIFRLPQAQQRAALFDAELPEVLCSPHNVGLNRKVGTSDRIQFTLEAIPTEKFERAVSIVEGKRVACGNTSYVAHFEQTVERQYDVILDALRHYVRKITAPFARVFESRATGNLKFVPTKRPEKLSGVDPRHIPVDIVAPDSPFSVLGEQKHSTRVSRKAESMPEVCPVPPTAEDVRQSAGGESDWLHLLYAVEGGAGGQPVLPSGEERGDTGTSGVAAGNGEEINDERISATDTASTVSPDTSGASCGTDPIPTPEGRDEAGDGGGSAVRAVGPEDNQGQGPDPEAHR